MSDCLFFVVPCYRDADTLPVSVPVFIQKLDALSAAGTISENSRLMLVNDGSPDNTWKVILELKKQYPRIIAVNLAQNVGEQNALLAGMFTAVKQADCVITMDSDLQDDIHAVDEMIQHYAQGCDIVYCVRKSRGDDGIFERVSSGLFYTVMRKADTGLMRQHANYRLMSKKAVMLLKHNRQAFYYLPCVVSNMDVKSAVVYHERLQRVAGHSAYSISKKMRLGIHALLAHSAIPITWLGAMAVISGVISGASALTLLFRWHFQNVFSVGLCIFSGIFLLCAAVMVGLHRFALQKRNSFLEAPQAPPYTIQEIVE